MAPNLDSGKKLFTFLGKSVIALLESIIFAFIPKPRKNVAGEIVLITGAGSGIGRLLALKFAHLGAVLVLWDVNKTANEETLRMTLNAGASRVYAYTCDCAQKEEVYRVADEVKKAVGDVSILINNAGIVTGRKFLNCPDELMEKTFDVNFKAHLWTYKAFLPAMMAKDHGHLVCISSAAGLFGISGLADYCASKFAAFGFAESIFMELYYQKLTGIKTTIVCPFLIKTGMFQGCTASCPLLLPIMEPEYVAGKIVDAILEEKTYLCLPRFIYFMLFLKSILPTKMGLLLSEYMNISELMKGFVGRKN
ncbi:epidermal retinol dehydrogenase 2-like [Pteronotus mesoamericanus]|uniref:epidermal retinol dehydrogenase 2-like n=1 Tax=Pteronotus mesoamericanus TaxID=1884717 RepID=UPI0023ED11E2|nr:epidermal retinol dehydrogenase 2-like [Pteronotus parnellii mesoamericanus]XP_054446121.1 epidermal retinol dehydrogenase 2-like [Pteronotus parnellii mesoamericanus]